jgi:hypothetical protein
MPKKIPLLMIGVAVLVFVLSVCTNPGQGTKQRGGRATPEDWTFTSPDANPVTGRSIFLKMRCYSCHKMGPSGEHIPGPLKATGPRLTLKCAGLSKEYIAEALMKTHCVVPVLPQQEFKNPHWLSSKYHYLGAKELIDLVAFLKEHAN